MTYTTKVTEKVNIYKAAKTSSDKIGTCKKGDKVIVTKETTDSNGNTWLKIKTGDNTGYIMSYNKKKKKSLTSGKTKVKEEMNQLKTGDWEKVSIKMTNLKKMAAKETSGNKLSMTMQLFGIPYQFTDSVDCRVEEVSSCYGRKFAKNFILDAPVVTIIPGKPKYLPGVKDKQSYTSAFLEAGAGNLASLKQLESDSSDTDVRLYDFESAYIEYMQYVNVLCRTCASFLELDRNKADKIYKINGDYPDFLGYDWKDYRWNGQNYTSTAGAAASAAYDSTSETMETWFSAVKDCGSSIIDWFSGITGDKKTGNTGADLANAAKAGINATENSEKKVNEDEISIPPAGSNPGVDTGYDNNQIDVTDSTYYYTDEEKSLIEKLGRRVHYVQFYCDPTASSYGESQSNTSQSSTLKGALDSGSSVMKEIAFLANSGGVGTNGLEKLGKGLLDAVGGVLGTVSGAISESAGSLVKRVESLAENVLHGENIIMPDFYAGSSRGASIELSIPLKPIYGNKYSYYMDFLVPLMHILPLVFPLATSANSYASPFLVKTYIRGHSTCNLGLVTNMSLQWEDSYNADGLPMGATVNLSIQDLYPDIGLTPSNHPLTFINNSSLLEYLATRCGLSLLESKFTEKINLLINNLKVLPSDVVDSALGKVGEKIDELLYSFTGL